MKQIKWLLSDHQILKQKTFDVLGTSPCTSIVFDSANFETEFPVYGSIVRLLERSYIVGLVSILSKLKNNNCKSMKFHND